MATPEQTAPPRRRRGGQPGNRNARKAGHDTAAMRELRRRIWAWRRENRRILALARLELKLGAALAGIPRGAALARTGRAADELTGAGDGL